MQLPKPVIEATKELARVAMLAAIPVLIIALEQNKLNARVLYATVGIAVLRAVDKYLHEAGKATDNATLKGGLTRF